MPLVLGLQRAVLCGGGLVVGWCWCCGFLDRLARLAWVLGLRLLVLPGWPPLTEPENGEAGSHWEKRGQALL